jgi:hypothetical protein
MSAGVPFFLSPPFLSHLFLLPLPVQVTTISFHNKPLTMQVTCDMDKLSRDTSIDLQYTNVTKRFELDFFQGKLYTRKNYYT